MEKQRVLDLLFSLTGKIPEICSKEFDAIAYVLFYVRNLISNKHKIFDINLLSTREQRIKFLKTHVKFWWQNYGIFLDPMQLYQANNNSYIELLKMTQFLIKHKSYKTDSIEHFDNEAITLKIINLDENFQKLLVSGHNCKEILQNNTDNEIFDKTELDKSIHEITQELQDQISHNEKNLKRLKTEKLRTNEVLESKCEELRQNNRRLDSMGALMPKHLNDLSKLHSQIQKLNESYIVKFRNLTFLTHHSKIWK